MTDEPSCKDEARAANKARSPGSGLRDTRYEWAYLFGAVCHERGVAAGLVLPFANTEAMNAHLAEIYRMVAPGAHAFLVLDGAGWHSSKVWKFRKTSPYWPSRLMHPS